jgi:hypothetical protein
MFNQMLPTSLLGQAIVALAIQSGGGTSVVLLAKVFHANGDVGHSNSSHRLCLIYPRHVQKVQFDNLRKTRYNKIKLGGLVKSPVTNPGQ